jgi:prevent-host-death family protein
VTAYSVAEAKNTLPKLIDRTLQGEEVVITRHGKPVAELRAVQQPPARPRGTLEWLRSPGVSMRPW